MDDTLWQLSESYSFDHVLYAHDLLASAAHVQGLVESGLLDVAEGASLLAALEQIREEFASGAFVAGPRDEDVHSAIERRATELAGDVGAKLHTGRSRNDQVATTLRLFTRDAVTEIASATLDLASSLVSIGAGFPDAYLPGYTHLQRAQPVLLTHHLNSPRCRPAARRGPPARRARPSRGLPTRSGGGRRHVFAPGALSDGGIARLRRGVHELDGRRE